jgi:methyl-accepting chemotaxis protein
MSRFFTQVYARIGIVAPLLGGYLLAALIAIGAVQAWTLHIAEQSEYQSAQARLDTDMAVLRLALAHLGSDWRLDDDGQLMLGDQPAEGLDALVAEVSRITHDQVTVFAGDTRIATSLRRPGGTRPVGTKLAAGPVRDAVVGHGQAYRGLSDILGTPYFTAYEPLSGTDGKQIGIIFVGVPRTDMQAVSSGILWQSSLTGLLAMLLVVGIGWLVVRATLRPLLVLANTVDAIGDGHFDATVPCTTHAGPLGEVSRAVETLREKAQRAKALETGASADRADKTRRQDAMDRLIQDFGTSISGVLLDLIRSVASMRAASGEMAHAAGRARLEVTTTAAAAKKSAADLPRMTAATAVLTTSVQDIARQADAAVLGIYQAMDQARVSDATVRGLDHAAGEISEALDLIGDVTSQANQLALNAMAGVARAGESGDGFAAVANRVKQFAAKTAHATWRIGLQVAAIQGAAGEAAEAVRGAVATVERVGDAATAIATAVEEQSVASREIAELVQSVAQAADVALQALQTASQAAERSGDTSQTVLLAADEVTRISGSLREDVDHFVNAVRTSQQGGKRRKYERIPGRDTAARLWTAKLGPGSAVIIDISLGGAALACDWACEPGTEILVDLPGVGTPVSSRVINARGSVLAVAFRQDPETLTRVGQAIDRINAKAGRAKGSGAKAA